MQAGFILHPIAYCSNVTETRVLKTNALLPKRGCHWQQAGGQVVGIALPVLLQPHPTPTPATPHPNPLPWRVSLAIPKGLHVPI